MKKENLSITLIGDSTVTNEVGWGLAWAQKFNPCVTVLNFASAGRSSKSWYDENRLPEALASRPDYVLIQFGHNDQPGKGPERETDPATSFRDNLRMYVREFKAVGAEPILLSSVTRRMFDEDGRIRSTLGPWAEAARAVAEEQGIVFIDLHALSVALHNAMGPEGSMTFNPEPKDLTHFNAVGAEEVAKLILTELAAQQHPLITYLEKPLVSEHV